MSNTGDKKDKKYKECLKKAKSRTDLSLCPRGYCTAKDKFKVYPSAYANGFAVQVCRGVEADVEGKKKKEKERKSSHKGEGKHQKGGTSNHQEGGNLHRWFAEKWVNVCEKDSNGNFKPCGRKEATLEAKHYPYCRPLKKLDGTKVVTAKELSATDIKTMCKKKKSIEPGVDGKPTRVILRKETKRKDKNDKK